MPDRRSITFALEALAQHLAMPTHRLRPLARAAFRWFLVGPAPLHLAEGALALHFFLEHPQRGIDVVVADEDLHRGDAFLICCRAELRGRGKRGAALDRLHSVAAGLPGQAC